MVQGRTSDTSKLNRMCIVERYCKLPCGNYHGYQHDSAGHQPRASARGALALRGIFETVDATSCPSQYNFHMHTVCSDGQLTPAELIEQAIGLGLKEFAVTDHHTLKGYYQAKQYMEDWQWRHPAPDSSGCDGRVFIGGCHGFGQGLKSLRS
jgi:hypothetical protein